MFPLRKKDKVRLSKCDGSRALFDSGIRAAEQRDGNRPNRYEWSLCEGKLALCDAQNELCESAQKCSEPVRTSVLAIQLSSGDSETIAGNDQGRDNPRRGKRGIREEKELAYNQCKARLYDIRNAGPRHRFTVSRKLVHNCGYGGSVGTLKAMEAIEMGVPVDELLPLVKAWRSANSHIVQFWWNVDRAIKDTIRDHLPHTVGPLCFYIRRGEQRQH